MKAISPLRLTISAIKKTLVTVPVVLSAVIPVLSTSPAQATEPVLPPFPPGLFFPIDRRESPTIPGATIVPSNPVFYFQGIPGWIQGEKVTNSMKITIPKYEMLVIRGSKIQGHEVVIPPGGLYFDSSPARGELPMTGASDFFLGKRFYFVDYDARIHVRRNIVVRPKQLTVVGNHLYTMLLPPIPKVVPNPVVNWRTFDGVSIRPWAFTERWENPSEGQPDQKPLTYLQGVIKTADKNGVVFTSLTGTSIHREWWARTLVFEGSAKEGQTWIKKGRGVRIDRIDTAHSTVTVSFIHHGKVISTRTLEAKNSSTLPENSVLRKKMVAISGSQSVVLWPHDAIKNGEVHLWVYGGVSQWRTNQPVFGLRHMAYFPIACPIAHHIGGMIYNTTAIHVAAGEPLRILGGYATLKVVSVKGDAVKFLLETTHGRTPIMAKSGNIDAVIGAGRAAHGILATLDTTDLTLDKDLSVIK